MTAKPFSQACENNKDPILQVLKTAFTEPATVWEIGSGTGQHACHFARHLPHLEWQPTDRAEHLPGIALWRDEAGLDNLRPALALDVTDAIWPCNGIDALFSANTLHIMGHAEVEVLFQRLRIHLSPVATACFYGPFNYQGRYTSDSNARFDEWLKQRDPRSGIKDYEWIADLAASAGLTAVADVEMPANNRTLVFRTG
ncbi:DUF938 domain-containing protein [Methylomonas sp. UP202]|uniref:DUF938 domain-containing protein n=1 Tax=Methylomonas sp. UP202 TaxID=3040943 RepID=UPI0024788DC2|nr:DUF938 domain-containing protein [Methylomonas sp. UP202]WGS87720.1 DUF938 domain-containing protein [Methylomonas sp. UP202]